MKPHRNNPPRVPHSTDLSSSRVENITRHYTPHKVLALLLPLVFVAVLVAHWPALSAQALCYDEEDYVLDNPLVHNPSWASASRFLSEVLEPSTVRGYYQPLTMISLMLDWAAGGRADDFRVFHYTNLGLHLANTGLVILLLYQLFGDPWAAALVGLLFGVHPLTVEPVTWIADRKTVLATFFSLTSIMFYVRYARRGGWGGLTFSVALFALALLSKPTSTPLPAVMLLMDIWPLRRFSRRAVLEKIPFFALAAVSAAITFASQGRTAGVNLPQGASLLRIPLTVCHMLMFYFGRILWPSNPSPRYPPPDPLALSNPLVLAQVIGTIVLLAFLVFSLRRTRAFIISAGIFFVAVFPTLSIFGFSWITASDKYVYLPAIGLMLLLCAGLVALRMRIAYRRFLAFAGLIAVLLLALAEAYATRQYARKWADTEGLRRHMVALAPNDAMVHYLLGLSLDERGAAAEARAEYYTALKYEASGSLLSALGTNLTGSGEFEEAVARFHKAIEMDPGNPRIRLALANTLTAMNRLEQAEDQLREVAKLRPANPKFWAGLGNGFTQLHKYSEAKAAYRQALSIDVHCAEAHSGLGYLLYREKQPQEAIDCYRRALSLDPKLPEAINNLGMVLFDAGQTPQAIAQFREAVRVRPQFVEGHANLGKALAHDKQFEAALAEYEQVLRLRPNYPEGHAQIGIVLGRLGRLDESLEHLRRAVTLRPDHIEARINLAITLARQNQFPEAAVELQNALSRAPTNPAVHYHLAVVLLQLGQTNEALAELQETLRLNPQHPGAQKKLADLQTATQPGSRPG